MIHYHGLPILPETAAEVAMRAGHGFVSFGEPRNLGLAAHVCQSFGLDNGAYSAWRKGQPVEDWSYYYQWADRARRIPSCDFAVIPDIVDGTEEDNDKLIEEWPLPYWFGAPVWHMHESLERLKRLVEEWPRVCLGSSGDYSVVGTKLWWERMGQAMAVACDAEGRPLTKLHGLRMLDVRIFTRLPLASADSTNIGRSIGVDKAWNGTYQPPTKEARAQILRSRIESQNAPTRWGVTSHTQNYADRE